MRQETLHCNAVEAAQQGRRFTATRLALAFAVWQGSTTLPKPATAVLLELTAVPQT